MQLEVKSLTIDGEFVVAGADGIADYSWLHSRCADHEAFLYGFDLLEWNGADIRMAPARTGLRLVEHDAGDGQALLDAACRMGLEGIVEEG